MRSIALIRVARSCKIRAALAHLRVHPLFMSVKHLRGVRIHTGAGCIPYAWYAEAGSNSWA
jgi:hypothetical protein